MTDPITPALTPDEWANSPGVYGWDDGSVFVDYRRADEDMDVTQPHAVAALCLRGQPFGFTWADVDLLREIADKSEQNASPGVQEDYYASQYADVFDHEGLRRLADRIAALLPPRESDAIAEAFVASRPDADAIIESVLQGPWMEGRATSGVREGEISFDLSNDGARATFKAIVSAAQKGEPVELSGNLPDFPASGWYRVGSVVVDAGRSVGTVSITQCEPPPRENATGRA